MRVMLAWVERSLGLQLKTHGNLVNPTLDPAFENETDQKFFYLLSIDIELLRSIAC